MTLYLRVHAPNIGERLTTGRAENSGFWLTSSEALSRETWTAPARSMHMCLLEGHIPELASCSPAGVAQCCSFQLYVKSDKEDGGFSSHEKRIGVL